MKFATYVALIGAASAHRDFFGKISNWGQNALKGAEEAAKDLTNDPAHFFQHAMEKLHEKKKEEVLSIFGKNEMRFHTAQNQMEELGLHGINIAALLACIGEEDKAALIADEAIQTLEDAYKTKNIEEAVGGAIAIYAAYQQAVQGIPACAAIPKTAFEKKLAEPMTEEKDKKIAEMLQGFLKGANVGTFNFTALLECIYEADQAAEVLYVASSQIIPEAIAHKDIMEGIVGAIFMYSGVETFLTQALPLCEQVDKQGNWDNFNKHPDFTKWTHKELDGAYDSLAAGNVESFGEQIGALSAVKAEEFLF